jgi:hypothetical protein
MIGAAMLGALALLASIRAPRRKQTAAQRLRHDILKMVTAGGLAVGLVLIAVSITKIAHFGSDASELAILLGVPVMAIMIFRLLQSWFRVEAASHRLQARADTV